MKMVLPALMKPQINTQNCYIFAGSQPAIRVIRTPHSTRDRQSLLNFLAGLDGQIVFWDVQEETRTDVVDGRMDISG
jgi:hypothetical protein